MNIDVTFRHLEATEAITDFSKERIEHACRHLKKPGRVHAVLSPTPSGFDVRLTMSSEGMNMTSHSEAADLYDTINGACDRLARQIDDHHARAVDVQR